MYLVFARKYRPQAFDDIIGQFHVTTTLKNAISGGRVAHAYLFAGPRGVGKTTTARILAKALNCEKGPTPAPCNTCTSCKEITQGINLDILEIDGASNRGIDEIRNLRENVKFAPARGKFKVYIIDEVHMLTSEAFNALLKTLEEPPPHVKFIFATTQPHKVPATILSRCQRFDFRRIASKDALDNLRKIAATEKIKIDEEALGLVAKYADGSMRNAQVTLDQLASSCQGAIEAGDVVKILGIIDDEVLFGLSGAIIQKDAPGALTIIDKLVNDGKDVTQAVLALIGHFRNLSLARIGKGLDSLIEADEEKIRRYKDEAGKFAIEEILYIIYTLSNTIDFIRKSDLGRIPFEAALVKLTREGPIVPLAEIMERIDKLSQSSFAAKQDEPIDTEIGRSRGIDSHQTKPAEDRKPDSLIKKDASARAGEEGPDKEARGSTASSMDLEDVLGVWGNVIDYVKTRKISIASYLQEGYPVSLDSGVLCIGFPKELQFHKEMLEMPENRRLVEDALRNISKLNLKVTLKLVEPAGNAGQRSMRYAGDEPAGEEADARSEAITQETDPIVKAALEMFGGRIANGRSNGGGKR